MKNFVYFLGFQHFLNLPPILYFFFLIQSDPNYVLSHWKDTNVTGMIQKVHLSITKGHYSDAKSHLNNTVGYWGDPECH